MAARRAPAGAVVLLAHGSSVLALAALIVATHAAPLAPGALPVAVLSGITGGIGLIAFYRALATGAMGLTAALAGLLTAAVPVVAGFVTQGRPAPLQLAGFAAAAVAIGLIAWAPSDPATGASGTATAGDRLAAAESRDAAAQRRTLALAVVAGLGFGSQLLLLHAATGAHGSPLRALMLSRLGGAGVAALLVGSAWARKSTRQEVEPGSWLTDPLAAFVLLSLLTGLLDTTGNGLYMASAAAGRLDVAAMLASLYPGVTILLAAGLLGERTTRVQAFGMALAVTAVGLIFAG